MKKLREWFRPTASSIEQDQTPATLEEFVPQNELETLLMNAANDEESRPKFSRALLNADLYVATPDAPDQTQRRTLKQAETISILNVTAPDGKVVPGVFTSELRLAGAFGQGTGYMALNGKTLFEIVAESGAWLNPGSAYGVVYTPADLANLIGKPERRVLAADTSILLGSPAQSPDALVTRLKEMLGDDPRITEAYLALAMFPDAKDTTWFLEIGSDADPDSLGDTIGAALHDAPLENKLLDVIVRQPPEMARTGIRLLPTSAQ